MAGKWTAIETNLSFPLGKNKPIKSKQNPTKFSSNLTRELQNKIFCPLRTRAISEIMFEQKQLIR